MEDTAKCFFTSLCAGLLIYAGPLGWHSASPRGTEKGRPWSSPTTHRGTPLPRREGVIATELPSPPTRWPAFDGVVVVGRRCLCRYCCFEHGMTTCSVYVHKAQRVATTETDFQCTRTCVHMPEFRINPAPGTVSDTSAQKKLLPVPLKAATATATAGNTCRQAARSRLPLPC